MKVEVGKFYKTRDGEKVSVVEIRGDNALLSNGHHVFTNTGRGNCDHNGPCDTDLISEWKEETVSGPKFKVGDRILPNVEKWEASGFDKNRMYDHWNEHWSKYGEVSCGDVFYVIGVYDNQIAYSNKPVGFGPQAHEKFFLYVDEKPEITVNSRWTNIGKESKTAEVVYLNDKYVTFVHNRGTVETTTRETFGEHYKPYVKPPKTLVGWIGVIDDGDSARFTLVCQSEEEVRDTYFSGIYDIVAVKKIEWTEGE